MLNKNKLKEMYKIGSKIAVGSFATIRFGISRTNNQYRAIKCFQLNPFNKNQVAEIKNEIEIHKSLDHPNIISLHEYFHEKGYSFIVMEIVSGGDLY